MLKITNIIVETFEKWPASRGFFFTVLSFGLQAPRYWEGIATPLEVHNSEKLGITEMAMEFCQASSGPTSSKIAERLIIWILLTNEYNILE